MSPDFSHLVPDDKWLLVASYELEAWVKAYPRPLLVEPPLSQKRFAVRYWRDLTLGEGHDGDVASMVRGPRGMSCRVLRVMPGGT